MSERITEAELRNMETNELRDDVEDVMRLVAEVRRLRGIIAEVPAQPGDDPWRAGDDDPRRSGLGAVRVRVSHWIRLESEAAAIREESAKA
jgi:hypothetical protein